MLFVEFDGSSEVEFISITTGDKVLVSSVANVFAAKKSSSVKIFGFIGYIPVELNPDTPFCIVATIEYALLNSSAKSYGVIFTSEFEFINKSNSLLNACFSGPKNMTSRGCIRCEVCGGNDNIIILFILQKS